MFLSKELFEEVLVKPTVEGADKLLVVSGYASANMVARHADYLKKTSNLDLNLNLIVGMCKQDGLEIQIHEAFQKLQKKNDIHFSCQYIINRPPVHSKVYIWLKNDKPYKGFAGSANYTQNGFSNSMREILCEISPDHAYNYYSSIYDESVNCEDEVVSESIELYSRKIIKDLSSVQMIEDGGYADLERVTLSLLNRSTGEVPERSGLNWGQRPEYSRDPNQAYINIPADIGRSGFFPDISKVFTIWTDDNKELYCVRAQQNGKGLHTLVNSRMGEYFRFRLGLANGSKITVSDLLRYGRTDVDIYKTDEEYYYMDFSVKP